MNKYTKRTPPLKEKSDYYLFGLHAVKAAIENPKRQKHELWISQNAKSKVLTSSKSLNIPIFNLDKLKNLPIPKDKVHQGAILKVSPLKQPSHPNEINISGNKNVIIILLSGDFRFSASASDSPSQPGRQPPKPCSRRPR